MPPGNAADICAVTRVGVVCAGREAPRSDWPRLTLQLYLGLEGEGYSVVGFQYVPPCLNSDTVDFHIAGFEYVAHAAAVPVGGTFLFCDADRVVTRKMIARTLVDAYGGDASSFDFCPRADSDEIDAEGWDVFRIDCRKASGLAVLRCHRGPGVEALLAKLSKYADTDDEITKRLREDWFDQAFEIRSCTEVLFFHDLLCKFLMSTCHGLVVFPGDRIYASQP